MATPRKIPYAEQKRMQNVEEVMDWVVNGEKWFDTPRYAGRKNMDTCHEANLMLGISPPLSAQYTEELGRYIATEFAKTPRNLTYLCQYDARFPGLSVIFGWEKKYPEFGELMRQAREMKAHLIMEETMELADNVDVEDRWGSARVSKAKLQIGVRERLAKRYNHASYGDKQEVNVNANLTFTQLVQQLRDASESTYTGQISEGSTESALTDYSEQSEGSCLVSGESVGGETLAEAEGDLMEREG